MLSTNPSSGAAEPLEQGELASQKIEIKSPYYISEFELTKAQYAPWLKTRSGTTAQTPLPDELRNFPVVSISFADACSYNHRCCPYLPNLKLSLGNLVYSHHQKYKLTTLGH